jgi:hypothetical protein
MKSTHIKIYNYISLYYLMDGSMNICYEFYVFQEELNQ